MCICLVQEITAVLKGRKQVFTELNPGTDVNAGQGGIVGGCLHLLPYFEHKQSAFSEAAWISRTRLLDAEIGLPFSFPRFQKYTTFKFSTLTVMAKARIRLPDEFCHAACTPDDLPQFLLSASLRGPSDTLEHNWLHRETSVLQTTTVTCLLQKR